MNSHKALQYAATKRCVLSECQNCPRLSSAVEDVLADCSIFADRRQQMNGDMLNFPLKFR